MIAVVYPFSTTAPLSQKAATAVINLVLGAATGSLINGTAARMMKQSVRASLPGAKAAPGLAACCEVGTDVLSTYAGGPASPGVRVWQSQRNSPEMRLTEPATMTTPNT